MRASLMALDNIYHRHAIMPGAVRSSPAFDNASRALQRLTLDNEAAAAVATGNWQAMEQVLEVARAHNNPVVVRRLEVKFVLKTCCAEMAKVAPNVCSLSSAGTHYHFSLPHDTHRQDHDNSSA